MLKLLGLGLIPMIAIAASNAFASTYLERVLGLYSEARLPAAAEMTGWFSGRCYRIETPMRPFGALLVGRGVRVGGEDPDNGPAFPGDPLLRHQFNVFGRGFQGTEAPGDYWDRLDREKIAFVEDLMARGYMHWTMATRGSWRIAAPEGNLAIDARLFPTDQGVEPDTNSGYQVAKLTTLRDYPPYRAGTLLAACYFFKQVR